MNNANHLIVKGRVLQLYHEGLSSTQIHRALKRLGTTVPVSTVWDWCKRLKNGHSLVTKKRPGRPRSTTKEQVLLL